MSEPESTEEFCTYVSVKIDDQVLPLVKAAAALAGESVQDWLSDLANAAASKAVSRKPLRRRPKPKK
jgi:uncharacterized protein (DUF1778 family)